MSRPLVIAHRGASAYELENSLAAFRRAVAMRADGIELDVHASADGRLFVHHDSAVPPGREIAELDASVIEPLRLANLEPIPTLEAALNAAGSLEVFVEVKALDARFDSHLLAVLDAGPNPAGYSVHSFDHRIVRRLSALRSGLTTGVLSTSYPIHPLEQLDASGATTLWQEWSVCDAALVAALHSAGRRVIAWTVDSPERIHELVAMGVDGICTNRPDVALRAIAEARP